MKLRAALIAICVAALAGCQRAPEHCWVCEREIPSRVRATLELAGRREVQACCPRCALHYMETGEAGVGAFRVTDYAGSGRLGAREAYFVEGSDETPCLQHLPVVDETRAPLHICYDRCMPSLIAFRDERSARAFMDEHGGALLPPGALPAPARSAAP